MSSLANAAGTSQRQHLFTICCLILFIPLCLYGIPLGLGSQDDSRAVMERSVPVILAGGYLPSRSLGVPLYEVIAAHLDALGGLSLVNAYSAVMGVGSIIIFAAILKDKPFARMALALGAFAFNPLVLINASSPTEWSQAIFLTVAVLWFAQDWARSARLVTLAGYTAATFALVLTRPDFAVVNFALMAALPWEVRFERRASVLFLAATVVAGLATLAVYIVINGGPAAFVQTAGGLADPDSPSRLIVMSLVELVNLFGPVGILALLIATVLIARRKGIDRPVTDLFEKAFLFIWPIMVVRFAAMPDKLEYAFPLIPFTLLAVVSRRQSMALTAIVAVSMVLNSIVAFSAFQRPGDSDKLRLAFHVNKSALAQDWDARKVLARALDPAFARQISRIVFGGQAPPALEFKNFGPGYTDDQGDLIMSQQWLYRLDNSRMHIGAEEFERDHYKRVFVCNQALISENIGWRVLQPPPPYIQVNAGGIDDSFRCHLDTGPKR